MGLQVIASVPIECTSDPSPVTRLSRSHRSCTIRTGEGTRCNRKTKHSHKSAQTTTQVIWLGRIAEGINNTLWEIGDGLVGCVGLLVRSLVMSAESACDITQPPGSLEG